MKKRVKFLAVFFGVVLALSVVLGASMIIPANENAQENSQGPENSPVIGDNWDLERVDFIHYAKPDNLGNSGKGKPKGDACYKLMGVKWKSFPVDYSINPSNPDGLTESFVINTISTSAEIWDDSTSNELFNNAYAVDYSAQYGVQDYQNSIDFGDYPSDGVIAVTSVWFTRKGKQIVEFDLRFNTRFNWGDATANSSAVMDLQNIATHELGHAVGLDDIYSDACSTVTMYGYSGYMETSKRILEQPDIDGLQKMYGF